jgi:hypothetical protein
VSLIFAAISILLIGMFRDADIANADYLNAEPVPHERIAGYQSVPDATKSESLTKADIIKLNAVPQEPTPTF